jgi:hypothetical protein
MLWNSKLYECFDLFEMLNSHSLFYRYGQNDIFVNSGLVRALESAITYKIEPDMKHFLKP